MDKISVIIPVYNAENYITDCLNSIVRQTYQNLEILLIDDGSKDSSGKICDNFAENDNRIKVFHKQNGGVSSTRNLGLENASGDWISFVDSDDYLAENAYEVLLDTVNKTNCDIITFEYFVKTNDNITLHKSDDKWYGSTNRTKAIEHNLLVNPFPFTRLFKSELIDKKGEISPLRFDESIARGEDSVFNAQLIHRANSICIIENPLYYYVQSEDSACRGAFKLSQLSVLKMDDFFQDFYTTHYPQFLNKWNIKFLDTIISIYYDIYADKNKYKKEKKTVYTRFLERFKNVKFSSLSKRQKIKFTLFKISPNIFCALHKFAWKLK